MRRDKWSPQEWDRLCSVHFVSGKSSKNPRDVDYVPSVFFFNRSPSRRATLRTEAARREKEIQRRIYAENLDNKKEIVAARKRNAKAHVRWILFVQPSIQSEPRTGGHEY